MAPSKSRGANEGRDTGRPLRARAPRHDQTRPVTVQRGPADRSRMQGFLLFTFMQRMDVLRRRSYLGDLDLAAIMGTIALAAIEAPMRDPSFREAYSSIDKMVGVEGQRGVNATSVAAATGIPRQTVRRKIKKLLSLGAIVEVGASAYVLKPGFLQRPAGRGPQEEAFKYMIQLFNDCLRHEIVELAQPLDAKGRRRA